MAQKPLPIRRILVILPIFLVLSVYRMWPEPRPQRVEYAITGQTMGTDYTVRLASSTPLAPEAQHTLRDAIHEELESVNRTMSTYKSDSEVSTFNRLRTSETFEVSRDVFRVLQLAQQVSMESNGAFDITVAPLVRRYGFGPDPRQTPPSTEELQTLLARVGYQKLRLDGEKSISKEHPALEIDLSAIAKGFGVDQVAELLLEAEHQNFMVEVGGEMRVSGNKSPTEDWRLAIEKPQKGMRQVYGVLSLDGLSVATSGNYRNSYTLEGKKFGHTIDPASGNPSLHKLISATVVHAECALADAYATAIMSLGETEGLAFANKFNLAALLIIQSPQGKTMEKATSAFKATVKDWKSIP